jgi:hypothetical protein
VPPVITGFDVGQYSPNFDPFFGDMLINEKKKRKYCSVCEAIARQLEFQGKR